MHMKLIKIPFNIDQHDLSTVYTMQVHIVLISLLSYRMAPVVWNIVQRWQLWQLWKPNKITCRRGGETRKTVAVVYSNFVKFAKNYETRQF